MKKLKLDREIVIPVVLVFISCLLAVICGSTSLLIAISIFSMIIPILVIQRKTDNDWGIMFAAGIIMVVIYLLLIVGIILIAKRYDWLMEIILWPLPW